ncbi:MAG: hypothetical protein HY650_16690 [Acidobacteria bacterium]|nr:hypothetical protein [Acidobacteriota bacterium]
MKFFIGVDVGQRVDHTAIAVLETAEKQKLHCTHVERLVLGTAFTAVVARLCELETKLGCEKTTVALDSSGVGAPVVELARSRLRSPVFEIVITGGASATTRGKNWTIPKTHLISGLQVGLEQKEVRFVAGMPFLDVLVSELQHYQVRATSTGSEAFEARQGEHDDLVLALAIGLYAAKKLTTPVKFSELVADAAPRRLPIEAAMRNWK